MGLQIQDDIQKGCRGRELKKSHQKRRDLNYQSVYLFRTRRNAWKHYMKGETLHFVQLLSCVQYFETPWRAAHQASLSFTITQNSLKLLFIESVMPSNHPILCHPLFLLPSICPSITVFSNELDFRNKWPKYWNFSFNTSPSNESSGLIFFRID